MLNLLKWGPNLNSNFHANKGFDIIEHVDQTHRMIKCVSNRRCLNASDWNIDTISVESVAFGRDQSHPIEAEIGSGGGGGFVALGAVDALAPHSLQHWCLISTSAFM